MGIAPEYRVPGREELAANLRGVGLVFKCAPINAVVAFLFLGVQGAVPAAVIGFMGKALGILPRTLAGDVAASAQLQRTLLFLAGAVMLHQLVGPISETVMFSLQRRFQAYLGRRLMSSLASLPGIAYFEDPKFRDKLKITEWIGWAPVNSIRILGQMFQQVTQLATMAVLAANFQAWVPIAVIAGALPAAIVGVRSEAQIGLARWRYSPEARRSDYYRNLSLTPEPAKELRIFGLKDWVGERHYDYWLRSMEEAWKIRRRSLFVKLGLRGPSLATLAIAYMSMLGAALSGPGDPNHIDVGLFAAASMATVGMITSVTSVSESAAWLRRSNYYLPVAFQLMDLPVNEPRLDTSGVTDARDLDKSGIRFEGVSFTYPGTDRKILDSLDLWIPAGSSIALVGENGAGKTTLIKLLCRFYDPTEGRITLDGVDLKDLDLPTMRDRLAVIFQDFYRYHLSARDNVGFGAVARVDDLEAVIEAASRVGVLDKIEELPDGWETKLAREFGGVDLSGGEWQRIALARAMMADIGRGADILILDEPTASLDVSLEHELYEHFADLSRGRTTLLVSHRFSTVRMASRIVYLEAGRVVEDGTHKSLMALDGRYASLYELQASHYRLTGALE